MEAKNFKNWKPDKKERKLLKGYLQKVNGSLLALEVSVGLSKNWGADAQTRYIDGILLFKQKEDEDQDGKIINPGYESFNTLIEENLFERVELIEVKRKLNRPVIGQAIAGKLMMKEDYPEIDEVEMVVVCERADSALLEVCEELDIKVDQINKNER